MDNVTQIQECSRACSPYKCTQTYTNTHSISLTLTHTHAHIGVMEADNGTHDKSVLILPEKAWKQ